LTVVSLRGLGAVEGVRAEGSGSWAESGTTEAMAQEPRIRKSAACEGFDLVCTAIPPKIPGTIPLGKKYNAIL
jgi:hypothetical protein